MWSFVAMLLFGVVLLMLLWLPAYAWYLQTKIKRLEAEKTKLLTRLDYERSQPLPPTPRPPTTMSYVVASNKERLQKEKIEVAIGSKLGASAWEILQILADNPTMGNQEIAEQIFLSVEGVSSSLRRMYTTFGVRSTRNKRIALVIEAIRLSEEPVHKEQRSSLENLRDKT